MGSNFDWYVGYVVGFLKTNSVQNGRIEALECLRGFAAVYVVAGHVCNVYFHNPKWALPFRFAAEAVVLFFLLSGFVVRLSTPENTTFSDFFVRRIKRIYPLFLLSLAFSYMLVVKSKMMFFLNSKVFLKKKKLTVVPHWKNTDSSKVYVVNGILFQKIRFWMVKYY